MSGRKLGSSFSPQIPRRVSSKDAIPGQRSGWTFADSPRGSSVVIAIRVRSCNSRLIFIEDAFWKTRKRLTFPTGAEIELSTSGEAPRLIPVDSPQGERSRVANEIAAALRAGAPPEHFLVLQSESALVGPFIETLNRVVGKPIARDLKENSYFLLGRKSQLFERRHWA